MSVPSERISHMDSGHHEQLESDYRTDAYGYYRVIWRCTCGRNGKGAINDAKAYQGWLTHFRNVEGIRRVPQRRGNALRHSRDWFA